MGEYRQVWSRVSEKAKDNKRKAKRLAWQERYDRLVTYKEARACADCEKHYPAPVMEFDHLPGFVKIAPVAMLVRKNDAAMWAEIAKCELVCANCHRMRTVNRRRKVV